MLLNLFYVYRSPLHDVWIHRCLGYLCLLGSASVYYHGNLRSNQARSPRNVTSSLPGFVLHNESRKTFNFVFHFLLHFKLLITKHTVQALSKRVCVKGCGALVLFKSFLFVVNTRRPPESRFRWSNENKNKKTVTAK